MYEDLHCKFKRQTGMISIWNSVKAVPCAVVDPTWTFCFYIHCIIEKYKMKLHICQKYLWYMYNWAVSLMNVTRLWCDVLLCSDTRLIDVMSWHKQELELLVQSFSNRYFYYYFYWPNISLNCNHFLSSLPQYLNEGCMISLVHMYYSSFRNIVRIPEFSFRFA